MCVKGCIGTSSCMKGVIGTQFMKSRNWLLGLSGHYPSIQMLCIDIFSWGLWKLYLYQLRYNWSQD
ncbi:hypothetical protein C0J52_15246 [Blattella germanica]|nr:hypothetical protein C0J52_15246 [Blattella germanica]